MKCLAAFSIQIRQLPSTYLRYISARHQRVPSPGHNCVCFQIVSTCDASTITTSHQTFCCQALRMFRTRSRSLWTRRCYPAQVASTLSNHLNRSDCWLNHPAEKHLRDQMTQDHVSIIDLKSNVNMYNLGVLQSCPTRKYVIPLWHQTDRTGQ